MKRLHQTTLLKTCDPGGTKKKVENGFVILKKNVPFRESTKVLSPEDGRRIDGSEEEICPEEENRENEMVKSHQGKDAFESTSDNGLSPIEEETESCFSSEGTTGNCHVSEFDDYNMEELLENEESSDKEDIDRIGEREKDQLEGIGDSVVGEIVSIHQEERGSENEENFLQEAERWNETLDGEASGDNDETNASSSTNKLEITLETLKTKVADAEWQITDLKKQLSLEKFRSREFVLQCQDKCMKASELLKEDLQMWKETVGERMRTQFAKSQDEERKRANEEIARISELYSLEIAKSLKRNARKWQAEMVKKEKTQWEDDSQNMREEMKKENDRMERHMRRVEKRNEKSNTNLVKQMESWERHLKEEVVKSGEDNCKKLRKQMELWINENSNWHTDGGKELRGEWQVEVQRMNKDAVKRKGLDVQVDAQRLDEDDFLKRLNGVNCKNLLRMEKGLKMEMKAQRGHLARRVDDKIGKLWVAFEEFKHNFTLNAIYQSNEKGGSLCGVNTSIDSDTAASSDSCDEPRVKFHTRPQTVNSATSTGTNKAIRRRDSKHVTFRQKSSVEMPIVPQMRDDRRKK